MGPAYCAKCESSCAYGREYLKMKGEEIMAEKRFLTADEKAEYAIGLMDGGKSDMDAAQEAGYKTVASMKTSISQYKARRRLWKPAEKSSACADVPNVDALCKEIERIARKYPGAEGDIDILLHALDAENVMRLDTTAKRAEFAARLTDLEKTLDLIMQQEAAPAGIGPDTIMAVLEYPAPEGTKPAVTLMLPEGMRIDALAGKYGWYGVLPDEGPVMALEITLTKVPYDQVAAMAEELMTAARLLQAVK
jgi:hypothetical protein